MIGNILERDSEKSDGRNGPLVSIISPSYNQGKHIEKMLLTVKNQKYENIEHIVVDGGSTDETKDILNKYGREYNMKWASEADGGMYEAINKGMGKANGEILAYLNTDDLYFPWTVGTVVEEYLHRKDAKLIYGDMISRDLESGRDKLMIFPRKMKIDRLIRSGWLGQPTVFFRRELLQKVGYFDEKMKYLGDYDYWIRVGRKYNIAKCEEVLAIQTNHSETKRHTQMKEIEKEAKVIKKKNSAPTGVVKAMYNGPDYGYSIYMNVTSLAEFAMRYCIKKNEAGRIGRRRPWRQFMEYTGFRIESWRKYIASMIPVVGKRYHEEWMKLEY